MKNTGNVHVDNKARYRGTEFTVTDGVIYDEKLCTHAENFKAHPKASQSGVELIAALLTYVRPPMINDSTPICRGCMGLHGRACHETMAPGLRHENLVKGLTSSYSPLTGTNRREGEEQTD